MYVTAPVTLFTLVVPLDGDSVTFRGKGADDSGQPTISATFTLHGYTLRDRGPAGVVADDRLRLHLMERWDLLTGELRTPLGMTSS